MILVAGALLAWSSEAAAVATDQPPKINYTTYSDGQLSAALDIQMKGPRQDWCGVLVPLTHQMVTRGGFSARISSLEIFSNMHCALSEERWSDAYRAMVAFERKSGGRIEFPYSVAIAQSAEQFAVAEARLFAHLDSGKTASVSDREARVVWNLSRAYYRAKRSNDRLDLLRKLSVPERLAKFPSDDGRSIGSLLFFLEAEAGNTEAAVALLPNLKSPDGVIGALADRRYSALWPQIEAKVGPNLATLIHAQVALYEAEVAAAPGSESALRNLAGSYLMAGRFEDVVKLVEAREPAADGYGKLTEDMAWALNAKVYALDALGRGDEAAVTFDRIAAVELNDRTRGWLVNFVINRAIRLVDVGKAAQGLEAAQLAGDVAAEAGSEFARMLVRRTKICALSALGRIGEAKPLLDETSALASEAQPVAAEAMICANADDEAAKIVIAALNDQATAGAMLEALQRPEFGLWYNDSVLPSLSDRLRKRSDVAPLFEKLGRDIPRDFVPLLSERRAKLKVAAVPAP